MLELGEMSEEEFCNVVAKYPSVHAFAKYPPKQARIYEPLPEGIYDVIYADPPWSFANWTDFRPEEHYQTLSTEKIAELKELLSEKVGKNAVLFLWTPNGILEEALEVMEAWGFKYKTNIVWVKDKPLMGYYTKSQHELLLIGIKGSIGTPEEQDKPPSAILFTKANRRHSEKPEEVYNIIETMYPSHKYLELFARNKRENWKSWGNEVES